MYDILSCFESDTVEDCDRQTDGQTDKIVTTSTTLFNQYKSAEIQRTIYSGYQQRLNGMFIVWYGILEFNVPLDTV